MNSRSILITGGLGGVGLATSKLLGESGFHVFITDIQPSSENIRLPVNCTYVPMDITDQASINHCVYAVEKEVNQLYGLINNAGIFERFPLSEVSPEQFQNLLNINLIGAQNVTKAFIPLLINHGKGRVVTISSESGLYPLPFLSYGMSKAMLDVWIDSLRMELAIIGIEVIRIRPGGHKTALLQQTLEKSRVIDGSSNFKNLLHFMNSETVQRLAKIKNEPDEIARTIYKSLHTSRPKKEYRTNVSSLYTLLGWLPSFITEPFIIRKLKKINRSSK